MVGKDADVKVTHRSELLVLLCHYQASATFFHRSYYESAVLEQTGCRLQQLVNSTHRISCQHNSLSLLEICPCRAAGIDFVQPFFGRLILEIAEMSLNFIMSELLLSFTVQHSLK